jgi:hypothetical protein
MATANATFTELVTSTIRNRTSEIADNVSKNNALYFAMKKKGKISEESGGTEIVRSLDYGENPTYTRYSGLQTLSTVQSEVLSAAKYDWVQAAVNVIASGREIRINSGKEAMFKLVKARLNNAKRTAQNNMSIDMLSDGSLTNQMGGLGLIVQNAGTGTVGGIDSSVYPFWQNKFSEIAGTNTWSKTTIKGEMQKLWLQLCRQADKPDLLLSSNDFFAALWDAQADLQRYVGNDNDLAKVGFNTIKFNGADVVFDSNTNFATNAEKMFFLNTDFLEMVVHKDANWSLLDERSSTNQDGVVIPLIWMGQMVCTNRSLQGVMIDAA